MHWCCKHTLVEKLHLGVIRRVNTFSDRNQWEQHDLQNLPGLSSSPSVSTHGSWHWLGCWHDGDAGVLVTLVVPGRPCWVCAKIKWEVPGQLQAICLCYTCCWLQLCSLCKNSYFLKWNESKAKGGQHRQPRKKFKHRGPSLKEFCWRSCLGVDWQPGCSHIICFSMFWSVHASVPCR